MTLPSPSVRQSTRKTIFFPLIISFYHITIFKWKVCELKEAKIHTNNLDHPFEQNRWATISTSLFDCIISRLLGCLDCILLLFSKYSLMLHREGPSSLSSSRNWKQLCKLFILSKSFFHLQNKNANFNNLVLLCLLFTMTSTKFVLIITDWFIGRIVYFTISANERKGPTIFCYSSYHSHGRLSEYQHRITEDDPFMRNYIKDPFTYYIFI